MYHHHEHSPCAQPEDSQACTITTHTRPVLPDTGPDTTLSPCAVRKNISLGLTPHTHPVLSDRSFSGLDTHHTLSPCAVRQKFLWARHTPHTHPVLSDRSFSGLDTHHTLSPCTVRQTFPLAITTHATLTLHSQTKVFQGP